LTGGGRERVLIKDESLNIPTPTLSNEELDLLMNGIFVPDLELGSGRQYESWSMVTVFPRTLLTHNLLIGQAGFSPPRMIGKAFYPQ